MKYDHRLAKPGTSFVLLSIGSNLGDKAQNIENAYEYLISAGVLENAVMSSFYETEPFGVLEQDWFLNAAIAGSTNLNPYGLLKAIKDIEYSCGREKRQRWHEREMDIDILLFGNTVMDEEKLRLPHSQMHKRRFVLVPANEICPDIIHPVFNMKVSDLLEECPDQSEIRMY
jgi:2-amino-4-hydroxy-6-hydroxymethyldihydropteridine diphosphokinase